MSNFFLKNKQKKKVGVRGNKLKIIKKIAGQKTLDPSRATIAQISLHCSLLLQVEGESVIARTATLVRFEYLNLLQLPGQIPLKSCFSVSVSGLVGWLLVGEGVGGRILFVCWEFFTNV